MGAAAKRASPSVFAEPEFDAAGAPAVIAAEADAEAAASTVVARGSTPALVGHGAVEHAASIARPAIDAPRIERATTIGQDATIEPAATIEPDPATERETTTRTMWLILLEAFGALVVLLLIVWWTMFVGRRRGERE